MRSLAIPVVLALALFAGPHESVDESTVADAPRYAIMDDYVRAFLATEWDTHAHDPVISERAYCVRWQRDFWAREEVWRVTQIQPATDVTAGASWVAFTCPSEPDVTSLHVHPAQTCASDSDCWPGGVYGYQCMPSDLDVHSLTMSGAPFALLQCDRNAVITYLPLVQRAT